MKRLTLIFLLLFSSVATATTLTIQRATVTGAQVYETTDSSTLVWLHINGDSRVGPNPVNSEYTCELWTKSDPVYSSALSALMSGKPVTIRYKDRGDGTYWCDVVTLFIHAN